MGLMASNVATVPWRSSSKSHWVTKMMCDDDSKRWLDFHRWIWCRTTRPSYFSSYSAHFLAMKIHTLICYFIHNLCQRRRYCRSRFKPAIGQWDRREFNWDTLSFVAKNKFQKTASIAFEAHFSWIHLQQMSPAAVEWRRLVGLYFYCGSRVTFRMLLKRRGAQLWIIDGGRNSFRPPRANT